MRLRIGVAIALCLAVLGYAVLIWPFIGDAGLKVALVLVVIACPVIAIVMLLATMRSALPPAGPGQVDIDVGQSDPHQEIV